MKIVAIIPAYNEEKTIAEVLQNTRGFVDSIIVVDDGSCDQTAEISRAKGAIVVSHLINRGLGAAIGTGFEAAKRFGADVAITLDADGQHDPMEINKFIVAIQNGADVVIGSRMMRVDREGEKNIFDQDSSGMPLHRKMAQTIGNMATFILFGAWVSDSQSGFRAFTSSALSKIDLKTNRMEVSSEIIAEARRNKLKIVEVPIKAIYTDYSLSKGQNFFVGLKTLVKLVMRRLTN